MINDTNQTQTAGDNAQQIQGQNVTIINQIGITEQRAREIDAELYAIAKRDFSYEAEQKIDERVRKLEDRVIPRLSHIEGALQNFADPSFQVFLTKANKAAACTDRESDYDLLSELLVHRIEKKNSRKDQVGLNRAVEVVDQITDEALSGLTVFFAVDQLFAMSPSLEKGLTLLNDLYKKLPISNLPTDQRWLDELDILDAVRVSSIGELKKFEDFWPDQYSGYVSNGIRKDGENWSEVVKILNECGLSTNILVPNILLENYVLLPIANESHIDTLKRNVVSDGKKIQVPIFENQKIAIHKIFSMYDKSPDLMNKVKKSFVEILDTFEAIKTVRLWWNSIPQAITVTAVGRVLAHANAKRCDPSVPNLN